MSAPPMETVYPSLKQVSQFRHAEVISIKQFIESEVNKHLDLYKRNKRLLNVLKWIRYVFINVIVSLNAATVSSLLAWVPVSLALYFEIGSLVAGLLMNVLSLVENRLSRSIEKHDENHTLAVSSLLTIMELLSHVLDDDVISDAEFQVVINERRKYLDMRSAVRSKHFHDADAQEIKKSIASRS